MAACSELAGADDQIEANAQQDEDEASPGDEALGPELVGVSTVRPLVRCVDGRVSIDVGAILVLEPVDSISLFVRTATSHECNVVDRHRERRSGSHLALSALGVSPALLAHKSGPSLEVVLDGGVLDGLQTNLREKAKMPRFGTASFIIYRQTGPTFLMSTLPLEATGLIAWREGLRKTR